MSARHQRRWHPLLQQWVLISAASQARPWSGQTVGQTAGNSESEIPSHDENCYLCPGVQRASGDNNPNYTGAWSFENDFASLRLDDSSFDETNNTNQLRKTAPASGRCRVLCWSECHNKTLADLTATEMHNVAKLWQKEFIEISHDEAIKHILIFENKGTEVGVSNKHPHGQIYACGFLTDSATRMLQAQNDYANNNQQNSLLQDLIKRPEYDRELLIEETDYFKTIVPFAARFPYESWIVPKRHIMAIEGLSDPELSDLAGCYQRQAQRYDALFQRSSPNVTLLHNAPCDNSKESEHWCFHIVLQPPLRDSSTLKYLAGFEAGSNNIVNPVQPELAARALRECSTP